MRIFDLQGTDRLRTAGLLIAHDLSQTPKAQWPDVLARHAAIHRVDFTIVLEDGSRFSSTDGDLPEPVMAKVRRYFATHEPPNGPFPPPHELGDPQRLPQNSLTEIRRTIGPSKESHPCPPKAIDDQTAFYDADAASCPLLVRASYLADPLAPCCLLVPAMLLAVSDSLTGNGFFFDPLPWMVVAAAVILISVLLWIPNGQKHHQATCPHDPCNGGNCQGTL